MRRGEAISERQGTVGLTSAIDSLIALALAVSAVLWANQQGMPHGGIGEFLQMRITLLSASFSIVFAVLWRECLDGLGLYRNSFSELLRPAVRCASGCGTMAVVLAVYLQVRHAQAPKGRIVVAFFLASFIYEMSRVFLLSAHVRRRMSDPERVIIVGTGRRAAKAWRELRIHHPRTKHVLGFIDDRDRSLMAPDIASRYLGRVEDLPEFLLERVVDELVIATPTRSCYDVAQEAASLAEAAGVRVVCLDDDYHMIYKKKLRERADLFRELVPKDNQHLTAEALKRAIDFSLAAAGLLILAPVLLLIALGVRLSSRGPVFFRQERFGYRRRRFQMWKFRSMVHNAPALMAQLESQNEAQGPIFKMKDDPRITPLGRILRSTSLDELPQLWNVLIGDMSLVGPRPMSTRDVALFNKAQLMRRFSVRPGITGMWQVSGRSSLSFDQWIALDFFYIDEWSLRLDLEILARTLPAVLKRSGAV